MQPACVPPPPPSTPAAGGASSVVHKMPSLSQLFFFGASLALATSAQQERKAISVLFGSARGNVTFVEGGDVVRISGTIEGLTPGRHGFHIHEKGDVSMGCASTLGHYNPFKKQHGAPTSDNRHVGDLGNIEADGRGIASFTMTDHMIKLSGPYSVVGRAVVVHSDEDDLGKGGHPDSLTTGHAGSRVACGVIGTLEQGPASSGVAISTSLASLFAAFLLTRLQQ